MTCLAIDHDFTSKILNLKLPIPENNGALRRSRNVIASAFFWYIKIHFCNMQQSIWMNNSWYKVHACFDMYSLTLVLINWNKSFRKIVKRQTNRNCYLIMQSLLWILHWDSLGKEMVWSMVHSIGTYTAY